MLDSLETDLDEVTARLTPDELFIAFCRRNPDLTYDLYSATRDTVADPFGAAQVMGTVNSIYSELWPTLSPDGLTMWFDSDRIMRGHLPCVDDATRVDHGASLTCRRPSRTSSRATAAST